MDLPHRPRNQDQIIEAMCRALDDFGVKLESWNIGLTCQIELNDDYGFPRGRLVWRRKLGAEGKMKKVTFAVRNDFDLEAFKLTLEYELAWARHFKEGSSSDNESY